ncbi:ribonuclease H-like protein [Mycena rebaudengoi]|nr:ribonuclease H-like protein [Mycena rebaudengoi]
MPAYAVKVGRQPGIYPTWPECEAQVKGFNGARFKKLRDRAEAEAWIAGASVTSPTKTASPTKTTAASGGGDNKGKKRMMSPDIADESGWDVVYSDGACKGNGQVGSVAGVGVWWGRDDPRNIAERCPGDQTNNRAELIAILRILETTPKSKRPLLIKTDSQYSIQCFRDWLPKWQQNNFISSVGAPVKNAALIRYVSAHLDARALAGQKVRLQYVKAHNGEEGNEGADYQANLGTVQPVAAERDWAQLTAELRERLKASPEKPDPVLLEVGNHESGFVARDPAESPTKVRRKMSPVGTPQALANPKPLSQPAAPPPLSLKPVSRGPNPPAQSSSAVPVFTVEDLTHYADGLLDDDDLQLSD